MFGASNLKPEEVKGKRVIELGSYDMNGSLQPIVKSWNPSEYVGVDIAPGPGVDVVCDADDTLKKFGRDRFDVVISTEAIEHTRNWRTVISNIKNLCAPGGVMIVTTCMPGHYYHPHPGDFWRYTPEDFRAIFSDCEIENVASDPRTLGVYIRAIKPKHFQEKDLSSYELTSIITGTRVKDVDEATIARFTNKYERRLRLRRLLNRLEHLSASLARKIIPGV